MLLRGDNDCISVGERSNVQDGAVLHTDPGFPLTLSADVTVGHLAMLHGCSVGAGSLIGMHATILNGAVIGKHCIIGANSLVTEGCQVPDGTLVLGSPGKVVRELKASEIAQLKKSAEIYVKKSQDYLKHLTAL